MSFHNPKHALVESWSACSPGGAEAGRAATCTTWSTRSRSTPTAATPGVDPQAPGVPAAASWTGRTARCRTPSCTATPTSASSTAPATPRSWPRRRPGSASTALAVTDHDGFYGVVRFAEAARRARPADRVRRRADARARPARRTASADPRGRAPAGARPQGRRATPRLAARDQPRPSCAAGRRARPVYDLRRARRPQPRRTTWLVLTGCRKGTVPRGAARATARRAAARELDRLVDAVRARRVLVELWDHGDPLDADRNDALAELAADAPGCRWSPPTTCTTPRPARRPLATALAAVRARRSLDEIDGWLPAAAARAPAQRRRAGSAGSPATPARSARAVEIGAELRVRPAARRARSCPTTRARRAHRDDAGCASSPWRGAARALPGDRPSAPGGVRADRPRARRDRAARLPRLLPGRRTTSSSSAARRTSTARAGARRPTPRSATRSASPRPTRSARPAVRAVPVARARRPARHRPRHRVRPARRGDPVRLRTLRPRARRAGGQRHHLPAAVGGARHGQGARLLARPAGRVDQADRPVGRVSPTAEQCDARHPARRCVDARRRRCRTSRATSASTPAAW